MVLFQTHTISIYEEQYNGDVCGFDDYGNPNKCPVLIETVKGDLQPISQTELAKGIGYVEQGSDNLYLPVDVVIKSNYKIKDGILPHYYRVVGTPRIRQALIPHQKIRLNYEGFKDGSDD